MAMYLPGKAQSTPIRRCSRRADRNLDQIGNSGRNGGLKSRRDLRCSPDSVGGEAHRGGKRKKIDGRVKDVHADEAIGPRRRIVWLRSQEPLENVVFPV